MLEREGFIMSVNVILVPIKMIITSIVKNLYIYIYIYDLGKRFSKINKNSCSFIKSIFIPAFSLFKLIGT